jgi:hypothetical protein
MSRTLGLATTILSLLAALIQAATGMTLFYMCRTSLGAAVSPDAHAHAHAHAHARVWAGSPDQGVKHQLLSMFD